MGIRFLPRETLHIAEEDQGEGVCALGRGPRRVNQFPSSVKLVQGRNNVIRVQLLDK